MVEHALLMHHTLDFSLRIDQEARAEAERIEARTGLPRAGNGGSPALDRDLARALVDAGYMPLADYVALYGEDVVPQPVQAEQTGSVAAQFPAAFPRRQVYRATTVRCTFAKPSPRLAKWERRAGSKSR
jgi:hypothetical protein